MAEGTPHRHHLRDLLYLDLQRAESIYSQLHGGLIGSFQTHLEKHSTSADAIGANLKLLEGEHRNESGERAARTESRVLHHALLADVEQSLFAAGAAADVNLKASDVGFAEGVRDSIADYAYLRARGRAAFEDFVRLRAVAERFNDLLELVARSALGSRLELLPEFRAKQEEIERQSVIAHASEGKRKSEALTRLSG